MPLYWQGTPLTPLAFPFNAVNAVVHQKKLVSTKTLIFSLHEEWGFHGQSFTWQRITKILDHISSKVWKNCRGLESAPERGGIGSVIELAKAK